MLLLQILRWALLGAGGLALANGISLSYGGGHESLTYFVWFGLAGLLLVAGVASWVEVDRREASTADATFFDMDEERPINITTHHQSGGTNIGQVNIDGPRPGLGGEELTHHEQTENGFKSVVALNLRDQFAAEALEVAVEGTTVKKIEVVPDAPASITSLSEIPTTPLGGGAVVHPPLHGRYLVTVLTEKADPNLKIRPQLLVR